MKKLFVTFLLMLVGMTASARVVGAYFFYANNGSHVYEDENISMSITTQGQKTVWLVENKTTRTIYLDLASSFSYLNGMSSPLYSGNSGFAMNQPPVTNRVFGGLKTLQQSRPAAVYSQPIMPLSPRSSLIVFDWENPKIAPADKAPRVRGRVWNYDESTTLHAVGGLLRYATDADFSDATDVEVSDYVHAIVYDHQKGVKSGLSRDLIHCSEYAGHTYFCERRGVAIGVWPVVVVGVAIGCCI